ncbi:MAG: threonylcarbamoyl-AMP synthase [Candidatus Aenigmarchaeota archaeon]|nr:threonylcarbamoyl-AMP synthase [Candidatus Aenigmarchaeota archaeon]
MKTKIFPINENSIKETVNVLKNGGICIYPTETCYGLGCDATNEKAIKKLRKIKKMNDEKKISIIVSSLEMIKKYGRVTRRVEKIVNLFMPAPLTLVIRKKKSIPDILNKDEIAFRIPNNLVALKLVKEFGKPITATSANITAKPSIYTFDKIRKVFEGKVDIILDGGDLPLEPPSTIVDMTKRKPEIIREGSMKATLILKIK